jgi:hypothetical protein
LEGLLAGLLKGEDSELLGMGHGHRAEEETVHDAEDGGVDGDAEGEGNDSERREPRRFAERAKCKAQILPKTCHPVTPQKNPWRLVQRAILTFRIRYPTETL